jgi:hypothetical protein
MSVDRLAIATGLLRDVAPATAADAAATRARILAAVAPRRGPRRAAVRVLLFLAATLALSGAWAGTHPSLRFVWRNALHFVAPGRDATPPSPMHGPSVLPAVASAQPAGDLPASVATSALPPVVSVDALPRTGAPRATVAPRASVAPPAATASGPPVDVNSPLPEASAPSADSPAPSEAHRELALYAAAHRAHFVDHDPTAALRAWDTYLAAAPSGRFAPEARYNRAIALLRLSRRAEARQALAPFASGAYGEYRREDASRLLRALGR